MKRRSTDQHDDITTSEIKEVRISLFKWCKLWLTNLPVITKVVMLVLATIGGTVAVPEVYDKAVVAFSSDEIPIPKGQTTTPTTTDLGAVWRTQVSTALGSQKDAIDNNTASQRALRAELRELEIRVTALSERGDTELMKSVDNLQSQMDVVNSIVQP